jgi:hypothetical protein
MAAMVPNILMFPLELFRAVLAEVMLARGVKRALRLRFINRKYKLFKRLHSEHSITKVADFFDMEVIRMLHQLRLLDHCKQSTSRMGSIGGDYIAQRLLCTSLPVHPRWSQIPSIAARLVCENNKDQEQYARYVKILCHRAANTSAKDLAVVCGSQQYHPVDPHYNYDTNLLAAAAYLNNIAVVEKLLAQRFDQTLDEGLFGHPITCAAVAGNDSVLDLLLEKFNDTNFWLLSKVASHAPPRMARKLLPKKRLEMYLVPNFTSEFRWAFWTPHVEVFKMLSVFWTPDAETIYVLERSNGTLPIPELKKDDLARLLGAAASLGWEDLIRYILTIGAPVDVLYCKPFLFMDAFED